MTNRYFVNAHYYNCPKCKRLSVGKHYYDVLELAEIDAAKRAGLITFTCVHCGASYPSNQILVTGEAVEVSSEEEALAHGLVFQSTRAA